VLPSPQVLSASVNVVQVPLVRLFMSQVRPLPWVGSTIEYEAPDWVVETGTVPE
jgi:hypothetical protein